MISWCHEYINTILLLLQTQPRMPRFIASIVNLWHRPWSNIPSIHPTRRKRFTKYTCTWNSVLMIHMCLLEMKLVNCWPLPWSKRILHSYRISDALMDGIQQVTEWTVVHTASHHVEEEENDGGSNEEEELVWHTKGVVTAAGYALLASTCFVKIPLHCSQSPDFNTVMNALGLYHGPKWQEDDLEHEQLPTKRRGWTKSKGTCPRTLRHGSFKQWIQWKIQYFR